MPHLPYQPVRSLWIGPQLPAAQQACIRSFLRAGHPFELFTYDHVEGVPAGTLVRAAEEILPRDRIFTYSAAAGRGAGGLGGFSNLFRYALLVREGGYWVDADTFCLRPFPTDPLVISSERLRDGSTVPNCGVIKCPPGHEFARYCFERADGADPATLAYAKTGPLLVAEAVHALGLQAALLSPDAVCPIAWFDYQQLLEPGDLPAEPIAVHLWSECFRRVQTAIPWPGPPGSILHQLAETLDGPEENRIPLWHRISKIIHKSRYHRAVPPVGVPGGAPRESKHSLPTGVSP